MPREKVEIPISRVPLYEAVGILFASMAYPAHNEHNERDRFCAVWCREHLRMRAKEDPAFASTPQQIRPGLFLMADAAVEIEMRNGSKRLADRKDAWVATWPLWEAAKSGREVKTIRALEAEEHNNAEGRAFMWKYWKDRKWDGDRKLASGNLTTRVLNPSRPVIHAVAAYWRAVLIRKSLVFEDDRRPVYATENDAERSILHDRDLFGSVLRLAEHYRALALSIPELRVGEDDLIEFRAV